MLKIWWNLTQQIEHLAELKLKKKKNTQIFPLSLLKKWRNSTRKKETALSEDFTKQMH
jgi:hypothetical protein